jgi:hypothetical protein
MNLAGIQSTTASGDFGEGTMGAAINFADILSGKTPIGQVIGGVAYEQAMKLVEKEANVVKAHANTTASSANTVINMAVKLETLVSPEEIKYAYDQAKSANNTAINAASNAAKNYALTGSAMSALKRIPGLPKSVIDGADAILKGAKASLDKANSSVVASKAAFERAESIYNSKTGGSFFPSFPSFSSSPFMSQYGTPIMIGAGVLALSIIGFMILRKRKQEQV